MKEKEIIDKLKELQNDSFEWTGGEDLIDFIKKLQKENEELKEKVFKRDKELIRLEEYANKNFERKDDVKAKYIPKEKIRKKLEELEYFYKKEVKPIMYQWTDFTAEEHYKELIHNLKELLEEE